MTSEARTAVGQPLRRKEDGRLLRGTATYLDDVPLPGALHLAFVRSPHAHAVVERVDASRARLSRGVAAALAAVDLDLPDIVAEYRGDGYRHAGWPPLARDRVRFVGESVAVVAAPSRYAAEDARDLVEVRYRPLPAVASAEQATRPEAPCLHDTIPQNAFFHRTHAHGDVEAAFSRSPLVVHGTFRHQRLAGCSMEGRGIAAVCDASGRLTVWASTQMPHVLRTGLARFLRLAESQVRVIVPDVGGGFGPKMNLYPEDLVACAVARQLGQPVRWSEDRREHLLTTTQAREQTVEAAMAADREGRILGIRARIVCDAGAYPPFPVTAMLEPMGTAQILPGPYDVPAYAYSATSVATNKCPTGAYRGVGMGMGIFVVERLLDKVAAAARLDPAQVRRVNFINPSAFPHTSASGLVYDGGDYRRTADAALSAFRYAEARADQARCRAQGRLVGIGVSAFTEYTGMGPSTFAGRGMVEIPGHESATIAVDASGRVRAYVSCPSQGQGHETVFAQMLAPVLGLDPSEIDVCRLDTDLTPAGSGTFGSRAVVAGGGALVRAGAQFKAAAAAIAARLLEAAVGDVIAEGGRFVVKGSPWRAVTWQQIADAAAPVPAGDNGAAGGPLRVTASYSPPAATFSNGVHAALVEVDRSTGQVAVLRYVIAEDCGRVVNPLIVEGQAQGGFAQGVGETLYEDLRYDAEAQPLAATLMDYLLPTSCEIPGVRLVHLDPPASADAGAKGMGESATIGAPACLANAVSDALGCPADALPITPERILAWLAEAAD